jgi:hypothetical protein
MAISRDQLKLPNLADFWELTPEQRASILLKSIEEVHSWHYLRNKAYRHTVEARGIEPDVTYADLSRLLRPTAQTFKSYIDVLDTPFPQDKPRQFLEWIADQLSVLLPRERFGRFRRRYPSLESFLKDFELVFKDFGFEVSTSSGTSGRSTIMVRDQAGLETTARSFYLCFQRYFGMQIDHRAIFVMPKQTRITMARMVSFSFWRVGMPPDHTHFTIPFPAFPDQVRIRSGRTFREGWKGEIERRLWYPLMNRINDGFVMPNAIRASIRLLEKAEAAGEKVLLFGGWIQLHAIAQEIQSARRSMRLAPGSLLGTGGGFKEIYSLTPDQIRSYVGQVIQLDDGRPAPLRDVYGMAEGNWAAMQCSQGNYHIPPWVYAITLDEDDQIQDGSDNTGLLAFFDPYGGGNLFPSFFKTTDRMRLINGGKVYDSTLTCPCGDVGTYISQGSIQRVDLLDEAGCAAQV